MKNIIVTVTAIVAIAVLAHKALAMGLDTYMYTGAMVAIAGLGGYRLKAYQEARRNKGK